MVMAFYLISVRQTTIKVYMVLKDKPERQVVFAEQQAWEFQTIPRRQGDQGNFNRVLGSDPLQACIPPGKGG
jgi:hypothetical protein